MSTDSKTSRVVLPSIEEFYPEHLLKLPHNAINHAGHPALRGHTTIANGRLFHTNTDPVSHPLPTPIISRGPSLSPNLVPGGESPRYSRFCDRVSQSPFTSHLPRPGPLCHPSDDRYPSSPPFPATYSHGRTLREHEKRHACAVCGRAFNRPSSLAIHENTHTGAQPYECPFPGCGRKFNVNSNMRRHFRNHTSPSRQTAASPYTYPLTTVPRPLPTGAHYNTMRSRQDTQQGLRPRAWTVATSSSSAYTDSSDEDELSHDVRSHPVLDYRLEATMKEATARMDHLRLRSCSSPGLRPAHIFHRSVYPPPPPTANDAPSTITSGPGSD
ncbi:hypothetical protein BC629DRAFT_1595796 [Irpex lacteus]|nr:hypothetical protein BC629DRAFT_1595796 [Irpex lacteus]